MPRDTYTKDQREALEGLKHKGLELGAARKEFVNRILLADGKVSKDVAGLRQVMAEAITKASEAEDFKGAAALQDRLREFDEHVAQKRFLIVADDDGLPLIWFQCAVPHNEDVYPKEATK
jgi:hypothetical protein